VTEQAKMMKRSSDEVQETANNAASIDTTSAGEPESKQPIATRSLHSTETGSSTVQLLDSPPPTEMNFKDFIMMRRKRETSSDEESDLLLHNTPAGDQNPLRKDKMASTSISTTRAEVRKGKQKESKWVRFLDVALTCPSDGSDDEILFLPPPADNKNTRKKSNRQFVC